MSQENRKKKSIIRRERKEEIRKELKNSAQWKVVSKHRRISPKKLTPVVNEVRGISYIRALSILDYIPRKGAFLVKKTIASAVSNAIYSDNNLDEDSLYIKEIYVNEGPRIKRLHRNSRGQADVIQKRTSHIVVVVAKREDENK